MGEIMIHEDMIQINQEVQLENHMVKSQVLEVIQLREEVNLLHMLDVGVEINYYFLELALRAAAF